MSAANEPPDLSFLRAAVGRRREGRKRLRTMTDKIVESMQQDLRVGDEVVLGRLDKHGHEITYEVFKVAWWTRLREHDPAEDGPAPTQMSPATARVLARIAEGRAAALMDPRAPWTDQDGDTWSPTTRELYVMRDGEPDMLDPVSIATDEDLMAFGEEASEVARAFADLIERELGAMDKAVAALDAFGGRS